jgi:hypothetical protein
MCAVDTEERRRRILDTARHDGSVDVGRLAIAYKVAKETVRVAPRHATGACEFLHLSPPQRRPQPTW